MERKGRRLVLIRCFAKERVTLSTCSVLLVIMFAVLGCGKGKKESTDSAKQDSTPVTWTGVAEDGWDLAKKTQFRLTLEDVGVGGYFPFPQWTEYAKGASHRPRTPASTDKKFVSIVAKVENLGPRRGRPSATLELKLNTGTIFPVSFESRSGDGYNPCAVHSKPAGDFEYDTSGVFPKAPNRVADYLEAGQAGWWLMYSEVPAGAQPVELLGRAGIGSEETEFSVSVCGPVREVPPPQPAQTASPITGPEAPTGGQDIVLDVKLIPETNKDGCARGCARMVIDFFIPGVYDEAAAQRELPNSAVYLEKQLAPALGKLTNGLLAATPIHLNKTDDWFQTLAGELKQGHPVIVLIPLGNNLPWWKKGCATGHYIVIRGVTADGKIVCNDPSQGFFAEENLPRNADTRASKEDFEKAWFAANPGISTGGSALVVKKR